MSIKCKNYKDLISGVGVGKSEIMALAEKTYCMYGNIEIIECEHRSHIIFLQRYLRYLAESSPVKTPLLHN